MQGLKHCGVVRPTLNGDGGHSSSQYWQKPAAALINGRSQHPARQARQHICGAVKGSQKPKQQASKAAEAVQDSGPWQTVVQANDRLNEAGVSWKSVLGGQVAISLTFGWLFQAVHNNGFLPVYDVLPFVVDTPLGPMVQAGIIPLVLVPIWVLYGYLQPLLDEVFADDPATERAIQRAESLPYNMLCWGSMAAMFLLSSYLYLADWPHWQISLALAPLALANWKAFDGTKQGALLAVLLAFGAPTAESFISNVFGWWHYERPQIGGMAVVGLQHGHLRTTCNIRNNNLAGVVAWAGWCYASYTHGVGNSARYLKSLYRK
eukprot:jgi/Astpho2/6560/Aster-x1382